MKTIINIANHTIATTIYTLSTLFLLLTIGYISRANEALANAIAAPLMLPILVLTYCTVSSFSNAAKIILNDDTTEKRKKYESDYQVFHSEESADMARTPVTVPAVQRGQPNGRDTRINTIAADVREEPHRSATPDEEIQGDNRIRSYNGNQP